MALWRSIGKVETRASGRTHLWQIRYGNGPDVGVVVAGPNLQQSQIHVEPVALEQGVVGRQSSDTGAAIHYTVKIRNLGTLAMPYNLHIGDWQPEGGQAPVANLLKLLLPIVHDVQVQPATTAAKKRSRRAGAKKRPARRR